MSLFTESPSTGQPPCPRCHKPQFVVVVARDKDFTIWDCRSCGPIVHKPETPPSRARRHGSKSA